MDLPRDFQGGLDMNLSYNLDSKSFISEFFSNNTSIKNNKLILDKGLVRFKNSIFDIDFSLLTNDSKDPINIEGSIPINKKDKIGSKVAWIWKIY